MTENDVDALLDITNNDNVYCYTKSWWTWGGKEDDQGEEVLYDYRVCVTNR